MKLQVENLGPISKAEVDLTKDFILLCGENNTGKTYLAYTIYGLFPIQFSFDFLNLEDYLVGKNDEFIKIEIDLVEVFKKNKDLIIKELGASLKKKLVDIFSTGKHFFKNSDVKLNSENTVNLESYINKEKVSFSSDSYTFKKTGNSTIIKYEVSTKYWLVDRKPYEAVFKQALVDFFAYYLSNSTFIIPAERQGINIFSRELSLVKNEVVDSLLKARNKNALLELMEKKINRYPSPIHDSLTIVENYKFIRKQESEFAYLADELETLILDGKINLSSDGEPLFTPQKTKKSLEIHNTSSTIKSLSFLVIYLRHLAEKGDFIIIDEPELNLHPDNQRKVARFLSRLVNEGFKVMISTHSDYIIREINNLIMLDEGMKSNKSLTEKLLKKHSYSEKELIAPEKIGAYLFRKGKDVEAIQVDKTGFDVKTIDEEIERLNETSEDIYFTLFDE